MVRFLLPAIAIAALTANSASAQISFEQEAYVLRLGDSVNAGRLDGARFYAGRFIFRQGKGSLPEPSVTVGNIALRGARSWEILSHQVPQVLCAPTVLRPTLIEIIGGANDVFGFDFDVAGVASRMAEAVNLLLNNPFVSNPVRDPRTGLPCPGLKGVTILVANYYSIPMVQGLPPELPRLLELFNSALAGALALVPVPSGSRLALVDLYTPSLDRHGLVLIERRGGFQGPLQFDPHPTNAGYTFIDQQFAHTLERLE